MQIEIITARDAVQQLANSWLCLQSNCAQGENSNNFLCVADHLLDEPQSNLLALTIHSGNPEEELQGLCILEQHRHWIAKRQTLANWIKKPGLNSAPLLCEHQRFSALTAILRELPTHLSSTSLNLRHLKPSDPCVTALNAICSQQQIPIETNSERRGTMCELKMSLRVNSANTSAVRLDHQQFDSMRSLP